MLWARSEWTWTELLHSGNQHNLHDFFLIATTQWDKKALLSFMYNAAFNKGRTRSQLWVYRFKIAFFSPMSTSFLPFHFFICLHLLSRPLSLPVCVRGNLDITPWPLTWPAMHSMCCEQDKLSRPALLRIVGEAPVHCNKSDLQPGSVRAAFILLKLCSVIKGYCTFPAFSCQ